METRIVKDKVSKEELQALAHAQYGDIIKAVVDTAQEIMGVGGELHVDIQTLLIQQEHSEGRHTWGINFLLDKAGEDFVEFDSMINLKPLLGNKTRDVENPEIRKMIRAIVNKLVI
ncbi:MAG: DUF5674 family protein [Patescibacteria group bacterium]